MAAHVKLLPSILTADFGHLQDAILQAAEAGADGIHLDVMDGCFVPNITFGASLVEAVRAWTSLDLDVHLMVDKPLRMIGDFVSAGADGITVHAEACRDAYRVLDTIRNAGCRAGLALNPGTACTSVIDLLCLADLVLIMSVPPGFGGAPFIPATPAKLQRMQRLCAALAGDSRPLLQVDGGIGPANIRSVVQAGAHAVVAGSSIYNRQGCVAHNMQTLRQALQG